VVLVDGTVVVGTALVVVAGSVVVVVGAVVVVVGAVVVVVVVVGAVVGGGTSFPVVVGPTLRCPAPQADASAARPAMAPRRMRRRRLRRPSSGPAAVTDGSGNPAEMGGPAEMVGPVRSGRFSPLPETMAPK
jgi:hypothetical protein